MSCSVLVASCVQKEKEQIQQRSLGGKVPPKTFRVVTLGCKVNQAESEQIIEDMLQMGFIFVKDSLEADISIVNTCTVTAKADKKSLSTIRYSAKNSPYVFVTGCYSDLQKNLLQKESNITSIIANTDKRDAAKHIQSVLFGKSVPSFAAAVETRKSLFYKIPDEQLRSEQSRYFTHVRSFVKIQDGCNNFCSFCRIPYARGNPASRSPEDIFCQLEGLSKNGVPELVITGINIGEYEHGSYNFAKILRAIATQEKSMYVRISSIEPHSITDEVMESLSLKNIVPHIHLSVQSGCNETLSKMRRRYTVEDFYKIVRKLRTINEDFSITTDVIVGFSGESERNFAESVEFLQKCAFTKMHIFPFSARPLTRAFHYADTVSSEEKKRRVKILSEISQSFYKKYHNSILKKSQRVLIEETLTKDSLRVKSLVPSNFVDCEYNFYQVMTEYYIRGIFVCKEVLPLRKSLHKILSQENFFLYENF